jgi:hypothetical protein
VFQLSFCVALSNGQVAAQHVGANVPRCSIRIKVRNGWPCGVASGQAGNRGQRRDDYGGYETPLDLAVAALA